MNEVIILIGSITYAMKAQKALKELGISAMLIKRAGEAQRGCSYGLRLHSSRFLSAVARLKELHIDYEVENPNTP